MDDKSAVKAKGLWEDWHMRQLGEQPGRINHRSGLAPSSRPDSHSTSDALTPTTPTSSSQNRLGGAPSVNIISGLASGPGMDHMKAGGLAGLLGPPPKAPRGRKKIKAENPTGPLLVVPYPILADQGCVTVAPKEGKTYRFDTESCCFCWDISFQCSSCKAHSQI
ncbi:zinc finger protein 362-like [Seriola lalandi dorsalis]|uniref:zinc finger protein 362-like n=1 Tax=Seriola lalandi dorsalis TaxID=1841481 RepID=UPI000C6F56DC|nr:zinc finger protein 362-like [Seriola lalandi dorsalis]